MQTLSQTNAPDKDLRRAQAYAAVFGGNATREDVEIVLTDLAAYSGFYQPQAPDLGNATRHYMAGRASIFAWIASNAAAGGMTDIGALHFAVLKEIAAEAMAT
jgi:hypothetical protein